MNLVTATAAESVLVGAETVTITFAPAVLAMGATSPQPGIDGVPRPEVTDPKLKNLIDDLYRGAKTQAPIGTGSTADAIRHETATGHAVGGKFHGQKGLAKNPNASPTDRAAAQSVLDDLRNALGGQ